MKKFNKHTIKITAYINTAREYIQKMNQEELQNFGHDAFNGKERMLAALNTIDKLAAYDWKAAQKAYLDFLECNLSGMNFEITDCDVPATKKG